MQMLGITNVDLELCLMCRVVIHFSPFPLLIAGIVTCDSSEKLFPA